MVLKPHTPGKYFFGFVQTTLSAYFSSKPILWLLFALTLQYLPWNLYLANTRRWADVVLMLVNRLRRWPNIKTTSAWRLVFAGYTLMEVLQLCYYVVCQLIPDAGPMLASLTSADVGLTLSQCLARLLCFIIVMGPRLSVAVLSWKADSSNRLLFKWNVTAQQLLTFPVSSYCDVPNALQYWQI